MIPFPSVIDASLMSAFRACPRKCYLEYFEHWKPKLPNVHLHAGGAYAHGMEAARRAYFIDKLPPDESIARGMKALLEFYGSFECPSDSAKSLERMLGALEYYFFAYPLEKEEAVPSLIAPGRVGIEFSFAEPLPIKHPETGDPLIYCGRMDAVVDFAGARYILDDKTTSSLGASWPRQWNLRAQFSGYAWGCQQAGIPVQGALIRGISILKTRYDTLQALTYRPQWLIDQWYEQLLRDIKRMIVAWEENYWDANFDESCNAFGSCVFTKPCMSQDPQPWLETDFERRQWSPITRLETRL